MNSLNVILFIIAAILWAVMDELKFHYKRVFGHWIKTGTKLNKWFNPSISWRNKYKKSRILTWLLSGPFVFITDFWHLLKASIIGCFSIILTNTLKLPLWSAILLFAGFGFIEEFVWSIFGSISDNISIKLNKEAKQNKLNK